MGFILCFAYDYSVFPVTLLKRLFLLHFMQIHLTVCSSECLYPGFQFDSIYVEVVIILEPSSFDSNGFVVKIEVYRALVIT